MLGYGNIQYYNHIRTCWKKKNFFFFFLNCSEFEYFFFRGYVRGEKNPRFAKVGGKSRPRIIYYFWQRRFKVVLFWKVFSSEPTRSSANPLPVSRLYNSGQVQGVSLYGTNNRTAVFFFLDLETLLRCPCPSPDFYGFFQHSQLKPSQKKKIIQQEMGEF